MTIENESDFVSVTVEDENDSSPTPPPLPAPAAPRVFYKIDGLRVTLPEYAHGAAAIVMIPLVLLHRLFRTQVSSSSDDPTVHELAPFQIPESDFPLDVRDRMDPLLREMAELGFVVAGYHDIDDGLHLTRTFLVTLYNPARPEIVARVHLRIWIIRQPARIALFSEFITAFNDNTFLWTVSSKPDWLSPSSIHVIRRPGLAPAELLKLHEQELDRESRTKSPVPAPDSQLALTIAENHHAAIRDFHVQRGVFVPRSETEQAQAMRVERLAREGNPYPNVLIELERQQTQRSGWARTIAILIVSLGLFIAIGAAAWSWRFLWLLIPILAFHELGHYVAMRAFRYRNVRMFFIPMMGAAVMGQNYTAPAWKKVLVALAGPLPGIVVGIAMGAAGWYFHNSLLLEIAVLTLILNGLQLLPVLPLDGGRVVHTLLFSRHYLLDVGFRVVASAILLVAGFYTHDRILELLGFLLLVSLPASFKTAKLATDLRRAGIGQQDAADGFVPTDVATAIVDRLKKSLSKNTSNKLLAQQTLMVYETIATRRAGWIGTIGFSALYGFSLLLAGAAIMLFMMAQHPSLTRAAIRQQLGPKNAVATSTIVTNGHPRATTLPSYTVIATMASPTPARATFAQVSDQATDTVVTERFGDSVIVAIYDPDDAARAQWVNTLERYTKNLCVAGPATRANLTLQCLAPTETEGTDIASELQAYLGAPKAMALIPPWANENVPPAIRKKQLVARQTYQKLSTSWYNHFSDPAQVAINNQIQTALRHGDAKSLEAAEKERIALQKKLALQTASELKAKGSDEADPKIVDLYLAGTQGMRGMTLDERTEREMGARMGQLPLAGTQPSTLSTRYSTAFGFAGADGMSLTIQCTFVDPFEGAPRLVKWLEDHGCTHITYAFYPERNYPMNHGNGGSDDEEGLDD